MKKLEISSETELSLSLIESGCVATDLGNETVFIYKDKPEKIGWMNETEVKVRDLEFILRPEFPSVRIQFEIENTSGEIYGFDYLFAAESEKERRLLEQLVAQDHLTLLFFDSEIRHLKSVKIVEETRESIRTALKEVGQLV